MYNLICRSQYVFSCQLLTLCFKLACLAGSFVCARVKRFSGKATRGIGRKQVLVVASPFFEAAPLPKLLTLCKQNHQLHKLIKRVRVKSCKKLEGWSIMSHIGGGVISCFHCTNLASVYLVSKLYTN